MDGAAKERELVTALDQHGWSVMRAPTSGSGTKRDLPDLIAGHLGTVVVIEAKARSSRQVYFDREQIGQLRRFAGNFGADARLAARWREEYGDPSYGEEWDGWYFAHPNEVDTTDEGNFRMHKDEMDQYEPLPAFWREEDV